jgi:hypothetical protein
MAPSQDRIVAPLGTMIVPVQPKVFHCKAGFARSVQAPEVRLPLQPIRPDKLVFAARCGRRGAPVGQEKVREKSKFVK